MDTYENENEKLDAVESAEVLSREEVTVQAEPIQNEAATAPDYSFRSYAGAGVYQQPAEVETAPVEAVVLPKQKKERKGLRRVIAAVLVIALVVSACSITAAMVNQSWQEYAAKQNAYFEDRLQALQQELKDKANSLGSVDITGPSEGMTPAQVYAQNVKSVVAISCRSTVSNGVAWGASGSGFVLTEDGYIVTNHHVIDGADRITVVTHDETEYEAKRIGSDASNDIALLKVEASGLQAVKIGSSDQLAVGSQVVAIGNALGELSASLTVGYISGKDRDITTDGTIINMLQTDAAINSGNSGGPLFNMRGEVVGITTAKYSGSTSSGASIEGICFAIPMDDVIGMLEDLRNYGYITGVQLGVLVRNLDEATIEVLGFSGVYVDSVVAGGCAAQAGVKGRDIILAVGGYEIESMTDLTRALRKFKPGEEATIKLWRSGREIIVTVVFDAKPQV